MKEKISLFLCLLFLGAILTTAVIYNISKPRVLILQSYDPEYAWTRDVDKGLCRIMDRWSGYSVTRHYMYTKRYTGRSWLERAGVIARKAIERERPRVLIAVDDFAQSLAARYFVNDPYIEIVFAGVNGSIEPYGYKGAGNVTGIFENKQMAPVQETILAFESRRENPKRNPSLLYIMDSSFSLESDRSMIDGYDWFPIMYKGSIMAASFEEWKNIIRKSSGSVDYIIVANYRRLLLSNESSEYADPREVMRWTEENSTVPVIGINAFNVEDGAMISIGVSPFEQGETAAKMAQSIIEQGVRAGSIPIQINSQYVVAIRRSALERRGLALPAIYEAFGRATANFHED